MQKSISVWAFSPVREAAEVFQMAREHGFSHIEVALGESGFPFSFQVTPDSTQDDCKRVVEMANNAGVTLSSLANALGWNYPMTAENPQLRTRGIEVHKRGLQVAAWLGVDAMLSVPGGVWASFIPNFPLTPYEIAYKNGLDSLKQIAPFAEDVEVTLGVENVWNNFLLSPLEFRAFLDEVNSPRVGCYFDVGNVLQTGFPEQWIQLLGPKMSRIHFKDFKREVGTLEGFCDLGAGDADFPAIVKSLKDIGYSGPVTAEFFNCEADLPKISAAMDAILGESR